MGEPWGENKRMASVMKKEKASVIRKGCHENKLDPGCERNAIKTVNVIHRTWVKTAEAVLVHPYILASDSVSLPVAMVN